MGPTYLGMVLLVFAIPKSQNQQPSPSYEYEPFHVAKVQNRHNNGYARSHFPSFNTESRIKHVTISAVENVDTNYRAQATSHYRNYYRNRNYFVHNGDMEQQPTIQHASSSAHNANPNHDNKKLIISTTSDYITPTQSWPEFSSQGRQYVRAHPNSEEDMSIQPTAFTPQISGSSIDGPILFGKPTPPLQYIRPIEHIHTSTSSSYNTVSQTIKNDLPTLKNVRLKSKYLIPAPPVDVGLVPKCQSNSVYCEENEKYPTQLINEVISRVYTPEKFQQVYGESTDNTSKVTDLKAIRERNGLNSGSPVEETPLCSSVEHTIYPRVAKNKENKWMYIVNHDEYIQGVRVEKCLDEGLPCFFGDAVPPGFQTVCRQKFIYKKLLALTPEGKTSTDTFRLPSCCVCFVKPTSLITDRIFTNKQSTEPAPIATQQMMVTHPHPSDNHDGIDFQGDEGIPNTSTYSITTTIKE